MVILNLISPNPFTKLHKNLWEYTQNLGSFPLRQYGDFGFETSADFIYCKEVFVRFLLDRMGACLKYI